MNFKLKLLIALFFLSFLSQAQNINDDYGWVYAAESINKDKVYFHKEVVEQDGSLYKYWVKYVYKGNKEKIRNKIIGYSVTLYEIDFQNKKLRAIKTNYYDKAKDFITSTTSYEDLDYIAPQTIAEAIYNSILYSGYEQAAQEAADSIMKAAELGITAEYVQQINDLYSSAEKQYLNADFRNALNNYSEALNLYKNNIYFVLGEFEANFSADLENKIELCNKLADSYELALAEFDKNPGLSLKYFLNSYKINNHEKIQRKIDLIEAYLSDLNYADQYYSNNIDLSISYYEKALDKIYTSEVNSKLIKSKKRKQLLDFIKDVESKKSDFISFETQIKDDDLKLRQLLIDKNYFNEEYVYLYNFYIENATSFNRISNYFKNNLINSATEPDNKISSDFFKYQNELAPLVSIQKTSLSLDKKVIKKVNKTIKKEKSKGKVELIVIINKVIIDNK